jgi:hypothetical protein
VNRCAALLALALIAATSPNAGRPAYADITRLIQAHPYYAAVRDYDRQIAALRAATFPKITVDTNEAQREAVAAAAQTEGLANEAAAHAAAAARMLDAATLGATIQTRYDAQAAFVRNHAPDSAEKYRGALQAEQHAATAAFERSLDARGAQAYAARAQQLGEREGDDALARETAVDGARTALELKLHNLRLDPQRRAALAHRLSAIDTRLSAASQAELIRDEATLAAYRASLVRSATADFNAEIATLRSELAANWHVRERIRDAQFSQAPARLPLANEAPDVPPGDAAQTARETASKLRAAGSDISAQLSADEAADTRARADASRAIAAIRAQRDALYATIAAKVRTAALRAARARGLYLVDRPAPGAVDITQDVRT